MNGESMSPSTSQPTVLFVCTHNAGRSALAAALARRQAGENVTVLAAGVAPSDTASHETIATLAEIGIDDSNHTPTRLTREMVATSTVVIAMKPGLDIPRVEGVAYESWDLPNPEGWSSTSLGPLRDHIADEVHNLLARLNANAAS